MDPRSIISTLLVMTLTPAALRAEPIHYLTDSRRCTAAFGGNGAGSTWQDRPRAFENYVGGVTVQPFNAIESWLGESDQASWMSGSQMSFAGAAHATVSGTPTSHIFAQGQANFDVWFAADAPIDYRLAGLASQLGNTASRVTITLSDINGNAVQTFTSSPGAPTSFNITGHLGAGTYHIVATVLGRAQIPTGLISTGSAACGLLFTAVGPDGCRADWDHNGQVDSRDFFSFLSDFLAGNADFDHSGATNSTDFYAFMGAYLGGC